MKKILIIILALSISLVACGKSQPAVSNFEECVKAGFEILESYPRECRTASGELFVEELTEAERDKLKASLANPASVFCLEQGGNLEMKTEESGTYGLCKFEDGSSCEEWAFYRGECEPGKAVKQVGEEESMEVAKIWILTKSPTYIFDGSDLLYERTQELECPDCYQFVFSFESSHAGYGDRSDLVTAQVITPHIIVVNIEKGRVISAMTDNKYDEIKDKVIEAEK